MRLVLVRHGETAWNAGHRLQGDADVPMSDSGRAGVRALRPVLDVHGADHVVVAPLGRTRETAELLGLSTAGTDARWREAHLGEWTGRSVPDLPADRYAEWRAGRAAPPGGESFAELTERVLAGLADLPGEGTTVVVSHGGPIRIVLRHLVGLPPEKLVPVGPATLTVVDRSGALDRLHAYNIGGVRTAGAEPSE
ncbi:MULTISPECIES: histidine phosphatase family protein [unclassified Pseudonocardia]|uniref:histidine phosphatase family protein n=1 Tax=unclassified Pseudonocardia TaxID=2619320 RepID=UPI00094AC976|nr:MULTISPECIES: histidine phosphatase family protein [unclassified Pseudonocardia]